MNFWKTVEDVVSRIEREALGGHACTDLHVHFIKSVKDITPTVTKKEIN